MTTSFDLLAKRIVVEANLEPSGISPEYVLTSWIKSRYREIIDELKFESINKRSDFIFVSTPQVLGTDGVVTEGSSVVSSALSNFSSSAVGRYIRFGSDNEWYRITNVISPTELALDVGYPNLSGTKSFTVAQRYYNISTDIRWIFDIRLPRRSYSLAEVHIAKLDEMFPTRVWAPSVPQWWAPVGWDELTGERVVEIYPPANVAYRLEASGYSGVMEPTLDNSPHPDVNERIIVEGTLADALRYRASLEAEDIVRVRSFLDLARSHENRYSELLEQQRKRGVIDAPQPRVALVIQRRDTWGVYDPLTTAADEVWNRPPQFGSS